MMSTKKTFNSKVLVLCAIVGAAVGVIGGIPIYFLVNTLGYRLLDVLNISYIQGTSTEDVLMPIFFCYWPLLAIAAGILGVGLGFRLASRSPRWWKAALDAVVAALIALVAGSVIATAISINSSINYYQEVQTREMRPESKSIPTLTATFQELMQVDNLWAIAVSPDGHLLAYETNAYIYLWDLQKNTAMQPSLHKNIGNINAALAFTPDSRLLVSAGSDKKVLVWDVSSGKRVFELGGHPENINCVAVSPDGTLAASGDTVGNVILWDISVGKEIAQPAKAAVGSSWTKAIDDLIFSPDGKLLAFANQLSYMDEVHLWDIAGGKPAGDLHTTISPYDISKLAFNPDGSLLAGSTMGGIFIWDMKTLSPLGATQNGAGGMEEIGFSPDGRWIVSFDGNSTEGKSEIVIFDAVTRQGVGRLTNPSFNSVSADPYFLPDGRLLVNYFGSDQPYPNQIVIWTLSGQ
jgi:WD40 repeat protein